MAATDRTLLARLGFADKDKNNPDHDLACRFLAEKEQAFQLMKIAYPRFSTTKPVGPTRSRPITIRHHGPIDECGDDKGYFPTEECLDLDNPSRKNPLRVITGQKTYTEGTVDYREWYDVWWAKREFPLSKGREQYKVTIGFLDGLMCAIGFLERTVDEKWIYIDPTNMALAFEVKAGKETIGNILRQISLYREYMDGLGVDERRECPYNGRIYTQPPFFVATMWPLTDVEVRELEAAKIHYVLLGPRFQEWKKQNEGTADPTVNKQCTLF